MDVTLKNDLLTVVISTHGAELQSITDNRTHHQYLWQGNPEFWGRRSPVLFPIVGSLWRGVYRMDSHEYAMGQHGFARDCEFRLMGDAPEGEAWFVLESSERTFQLFPRSFRLEIGYALHEARIAVMWRVVNTGSHDLSFQIGAHPAFNYPDFRADDAVHGYFSMDADRFCRQTIEQKGCVGPDETEVVVAADGLMPIGADTFASDAIIIPDGQVHRVSMLTKERTPYLTLLFASPLVGLWSPRPEAPFVCIEPWWGRCDAVGCESDFDKREYVNTIAPGSTFNASYQIIIDNV